MVDTWDLDEGETKVKTRDGRVGTVDSIGPTWVALSCGCCTEPVETDMIDIWVIFEDNKEEIFSPFELELVGE